MERKIYYNLAMIATITAIITSIVLVFLFYDYYNPKELSKNIDVYLYDIDSLPKETSSTSFYDIKLDNGKIMRISKEIEDIKYVFIGILPAMAGILVLILIFLYLVSSMLTSKIIKPIEIVSHNIESILSGEETKNTYIYEELDPFIKTIEFQRNEIEKYIENLKETEKIRREFTANISHELKTPLTSINGFAEMIESGIAKDEDIVKFAKIIHKEGNKLLELIDSIIKLSQIDDISIKRDFSQIDLFSITKHILSNVEINAKEKDITIDLIGEPTTIKGNQRMIEDLILNLVDNSIKYNKPKGKIFIEITSDNRWCIFKIRDTGIGIPENYQNRVFERFYRIDKSRSKKVEGTGLGLSIVKHTVEYHCGKIYLSSIEGEGTTIEIKLPK